MCKSTFLVVVCIFIMLRRNQISSNAFAISKGDPSVRAIRPRCGIYDLDKPNQQVLSPNQTRMANNYVLLDEKWSKHVLTYRVTKFSKKLDDRIQVIEGIKKAFAMWSKYANLQFQYSKSGKHDLDIQFATGDHGDGHPFDGEHGVLAHSSIPPHGDIHFDDDETWEFNVTDGVCFLSIAAHEIGHALGLGHSENKSAIMFFQYTKCKDNLELDEDDIRGIQALYVKVS